MRDFLDTPLFSIGDNTQVRVSSVLAALAILVLSWILARFARSLVAERLLARTRLDEGVRYALGRILGYLIFGLGILVAIQALGVPTTTLAVFAGALGVGIGFGLQDIIKNFVAGLIVLLERPVKVGDRIEIHGAVGDVVEIRARSTVVRTNDEIHLIVPNANFISDTITNWSYRSKRVRLKIPVGVASDSDPREVQAALLEAAEKTEGVLKDPVPGVWFTAFGESSLDFTLLVWTTALLHRASSLESDLHFRIHEALKARGIETPNPQRDIHIRSAPGLEGVLPQRPEKGPARSGEKLKG